MRVVIQRGVAVAIALVSASLLASCGSDNNNSSPAPTPTPTPTPAPTPAPTPTPTVTPYSLTKLVSDGSTAAQKTDANLKNPWGIVFATGAPVWISNNATQTSTLYDGTGVPRPLIVTLPAGLRGAANPTGIVANASTTDFKVTKGVASAAARFLFDGEGGTILGWAPTVDATNGVIAYDDGNGGAVYKGLAIASDG